VTDICLTSNAEKQAEKIEALGAFSGLKLLHIKKELVKILALIGRDGIFDEYTKHDISHIDSVLKSLDWIIPYKTKELMTPADWLMLTLSIYFHDLGMLVTKNEFKNRYNSEFPTFKADVEEGLLGPDYKEKILAIKIDEERERFLYQEYVRRTHAERIKYWILNESTSLFPKDLTIVEEIKKLTSSIPSVCKRDLAMLCESHHLSDLDDFDKYDPHQQYAQSEESKVNLHYSAVILRVADLLHITSDRTPSIEFHLINPEDPVSQMEWAKQAAVNVVRPQLKINSEDIPDDKIEKDTIEIKAFFESDKGFFSLMSYLKYAQKELEYSHKCNELSQRKNGSKFEFPWKYIDDSKIQTKNFEKQQLQFVLDQKKILDLLIGHTLYNDPSVVIRELVQNGVDATRLFALENENIQGTEYRPEITLETNSNDRTVSFTDNGTGMTLEIIKNHLLKIGSSRYQDADFKKAYPGFNSISRFGIGLLTCFLIADDVDIYTNSNSNSDSDSSPILIKIRKVHGKYLLKYIRDEELPEDIRCHGTKITLHVRAEIKLSSVEVALRKWIIFPSCSLKLITDGVKTNIGYNSPRNYLESALKEHGFTVDNEKVKVVEETIDGHTMAYALRYVEYWKEWVFLELPRQRGPIPVSGTCIEGIRVETSTPGFKSQSYYAILNSTGKNAPKTNVARSHIENTDEKGKLHKIIYQIYLNHISKEVTNISDRGFSITWAAKETMYTLESLLRGEYERSGNDHLENKEAMEEELAKVKCILMENSSTRTLVSLDDLFQLKEFWTIDCSSYKSADSLVREVSSSDISALSLLSTVFGGQKSHIEHISNLLCITNPKQVINELIYKSFGVSKIVAFSDQRRLDFKWNLTNKSSWEVIEVDKGRYGGGNNSNPNIVYIQLEDIDIDEAITENALITSHSTYILRSSPVNNYLIELRDKLSTNDRDGKQIYSIVVGIISKAYQTSPNNLISENDFIDKFLRNIETRISKTIWTLVDKEELLGVLQSNCFECLDITLWSRRLLKE
jgi:hypothetical protein